LILTALKIVYREELGRPQGTVYSAIIRLINGARILLFPRAVDQINSMNVIGKLKHPTRNHDPLYFLVYRHYISKRFTISQRVQVALDHHKYESRFYNSEYIRQAYRSGGILLWERSFDDLHFTIVLIATPDIRNEGELQDHFWDQARRSNHLQRNPRYWLSQFVHGALGKVQRD
jgi:uncharacterized protein VirK/YbjX